MSDGKSCYTCSPTAKESRNRRTRDEKKGSIQMMSEKIILKERTGGLGG